MDALLANPHFPVFAWLTITSVVASLSYCWYKNRRDELEAGLKHEMLQRGMSADDIVKVLQGAKALKKSQTAEESLEEAHGRR